MDLRAHSHRGRRFKIRQVFTELRSALGGELSAIELLQLSCKLVDATRVVAVAQEEIVVAVHWGDQLPLDEAFADGGWRIMARHSAYNVEQFEDDPHLRERAKSTVDRLVKAA